MADRTLLDLYRHDLERPRDDHYRHYYPGGSRTIGTLEFLRATAALADAFADLGVAGGDRVMMLCENRPEWHMVDLAVLDLGAVDVPVYGTLTPQQVGYQLCDSGAVVAVADTPEQMAKLLEARAQCPQLRHLVQVEGEREPGVLPLEDLMAGAGPGGRRGSGSGRPGSRRMTSRRSSTPRAPPASPRG